MSYTRTFTISLGSSKRNLTLYAQLVDSDGDQVGDNIITGFVELGNGNYLLTAEIPDNLTGAILIRQESAGTLLACEEINPNLVEIANAISGIETDITGTINEKSQNITEAISSSTDTISNILASGVNLSSTERANLRDLSQYTGALPAEAFANAEFLGGGARTVKIAVVDEIDSPIADARVRITRNAVSYVGSTNESGEITFFADDGSWKIAITAPGFASLSAILNIIDDIEVKYILTKIFIPPSDPPLVTGYARCLAADGNPIAGATVEIALFEVDATGNGLCLSDSIRNVTSNDDGYVIFPGLIPGQTYALRFGTQNIWHSSGERLTKGDRYQLAEKRRTAWRTFTIPAEATGTYLFPNIRGGNFEE